MQGSPIITCLIEPLLRKQQPTIFQGGTSWMKQVLNNILVWMVPYCAHKLLGWKNTKPFIHLSLGKAVPFTLESHIFLSNYCWLRVNNSQIYTLPKQGLWSEACILVHTQISSLLASISRYPALREGITRRYRISECWFSLIKTLLTLNLSGSWPPSWRLQRNVRCATGYFRHLFQRRRNPKRPTLTCQLILINKIQMTHNCISIGT